MSLDKKFTDDHKAIRDQAATLRLTAENNPTKVDSALSDLQRVIKSHFRSEECFYRVLDDGKRVDDRGLMHKMRNDHAAVIFTLESLAIRLRKNGCNAEWQQKLEILLSVLLPHLDQEEKVLFPKGMAILSSDELTAIQVDIERSE